MAMVDTGCFNKKLIVREGFNKKNIKSYGIFHTGGGGEVYPISITFFGKKKCFFHKKYKDDQNGLIHPVFHYWGGQGRNHGCQSDFLTSTLWF